MKRILLLAFLCLQTLILSAEVVRCRVVDSESGEPLGQLTLSAKDILNKMVEVNYIITTIIRYEMRNEAFHRYLSLSFTYNIDAKAKKTQGKWHVYILISEREKARAKLKAKKEKK